MYLIPVTFNDYHFLYELLKEKTKVQNISHKKLPTWHQHCEFNDDKPYLEDYVIWDKERVGRIYLTYNNKIGIHIKKKYRGKGYGKEALENFKKRYETILANIAPKNLKSQKFFKKNGFKLIQYTYKWKK